jgi:TonB family protein
MGFMGAGTIPYDSGMKFFMTFLLLAALPAAALATDPEVRPPQGKVPREAPVNEDSLPSYSEHASADEAPEVVTRVAPVYPAEALKAGVQGTVMLSVLVGKDGLVKDTRVTTSIPALDAAATDAVRKWVFKPAKNDGKPVAVWASIPIKFTLRGGPVNPTRAAFDSTWALLRKAGPKPPSQADALMRERIIRLALALTPPVEVSAEADRHFHRARVVMDSSSTPAASGMALEELAAALNEAPWWADAYYESAGLLEKAGRPADAAVALDLYLVADPKSTRWETVRRKLAELRKPH